MGNLHKNHLSFIHGLIKDQAGLGRQQIEEPKHGGCSGACEEAEKGEKEGLYTSTLVS